ncbi:MAG TPA: metallophosphoesterase [Anaerohalosphaeraceae bacterium]|jgi:Icc protein|nr:metallophosphoesterase [Anaerohalosphaeraceae bacterium]HRT50673.1 metallophosphoesterase [Anaerohalosphaeraceae bacterium]HRT86655.1 metallophosphoesterase [Anaerohalosphaeraceae bacterium]
MTTEKKQITVSHYRLNRRDFLAAACLTLAGRISLASAESRDSSRWAMLSDTHIPTVDNSANPPRGHYYFDPLGNAAKAMAAVAKDLPAGMVITGDLARLTGQTGDYRNLAGILNSLPPQFPVFHALGNHDDRINFRTLFPKTPGLHPLEDRHVTVVDVPPVRFVLLDSLRKVNQTDGELGPAQLAWLRQFLAASDDTPTLLYLHHNLTPTGGIADAAELFDIIRPARCVKAAVFGHSHVPGYALLDDIHLLNLPASGYTFRQHVAAGWVDATLTRTGGRFELKTIAGPTSDSPVRELTWRK